MGKWKGMNKLLLNGATMVEAVQMWFDAQACLSGEVRIVSVEQKSGSAYVMEFEVTLEEVEGDGANERAER